MSVVTVDDNMNGNICDNNRYTITDSIRVNINDSICDNINDNNNGSIDSTNDNLNDSSNDITNGNTNGISGLSIMVDWSVVRCNGTSILTSPHGTDNIGFTHDLIDTRGISDINGVSSMSECQ